MVPVEQEIPYQISYEQARAKPLYSLSKERKDRGSMYQIVAHRSHDSQCVNLDGNFSPCHNHEYELALRSRVCSCELSLLSRIGILRSSEGMIRYYASLRVALWGELLSYLSCQLPPSSSQTVLIVFFFYLPYVTRAFLLVAKVTRTSQLRSQAHFSDSVGY